MHVETEYYNAKKGMVQVEHYSPTINAYSNVFASISEVQGEAGKPLGVSQGSTLSSRFRGSASLGIWSLSPREGVVELWVQINWTRPLPFRIDFLINN